jgi:hypothetical protein
MELFFRGCVTAPRPDGSFWYQSAISPFSWL